MGRFKLLGLALLAVFATAMALSTSAFALELPENLPTSSMTRTWTGEEDGATMPEFRTPGAKPIICLNTTGESEGTEEPGKPLGLFHIHFLDCETEVAGQKVKCTDLNHLTAGEILVLGTWHLVFDRERGGTFTELTTAILFLLEQVHFSCSSLVLVEVKGEQLCLHLKATERSRTHLFHCILEEAKAGEPRQTEEWCRKDRAGECVEPVVPKLESSINHAAFKESAELALGKMIYGVEIFADV